MLQEMKRIPQEQGMQLNWRVIKVHAPNPEFDVPHYNKKNTKGMNKSAKNTYK